MSHAPWDKSWCIQQEEAEADAKMPRCESCQFATPAAQLRPWGCFHRICWQCAVQLTADALCAWDQRSAQLAAAALHAALQREARTNSGTSEGTRQ